MAASYQFDNTSSEVIADTSLSESGFPQFVMCWVNPHTSFESLDYAIGLTQSGSNRGLGLGTNSSGTLKLRARGNTATATLNGTTAMSLATWYHIVAICRSATDHEIFLNGVSEATSSTDIGNLASLAIFSIGGWWIGGAANSPINARIAYAGRGTRSLTQAEVQEAMYNHNFAASLCLQFYDFNKSGATVPTDFIDVTGNGNTLNVGTMPSEYAGGPPVHLPQMIGS